jgi:hypothetical protein
LVAGLRFRQRHRMPGAPRVYSAAFALLGPIVEAVVRAGCGCSQVLCLPKTPSGLARVPPGPCNNVTCVSSEPASVTFDLDVADSQAPSQR